MNDLDTILQELKETLYQREEIQEYLKNKKLLEEDASLKKMRDDIVRLKKEGKEIERNNLLKIYESHPLVSNFEASKKEVASLIQTLKDIIQ